MVVGNKNRSCLAEARWSGRQPECREINCGPPGKRRGYFELIFSNYLLRNIMNSIVSGLNFIKNYLNSRKHL